MTQVSVARLRRSGTLPPPTLQTLPAAVSANVVDLRARTRSTIMAVVKADGYGHGAVTVARAAVNTMPGMTAESQVPRMFAAAGLSYEQLVARLVDTAIVPRPTAA